MTWPITSDQAAALLPGGTDANNYWGGANSPEASGDIVGSNFDLNDPINGWMNFSSSATEANLAGVASTWGASSSGTAYGVVLICANGTTPDIVDGDVAAAVATIIVKSDGSWVLGTPADETSTTVAASQKTPGGSATLTATVADTTTPATIPAGTVQFLDGDPTSGKPLSAAVPLDANGSASFSIPLDAGAHTISAIYSPPPGANVEGSSGSTSFTVTADASPSPSGTPSPADSGTPTPADSSGGGSALPGGGTGTPGTASPGSTNPAGSGAKEPGSTGTGTNDPSSFMTDSTRWATGTPQGLAALLSAVVLAIGGGVVGWNWYWRRRRVAQARG